MKIKSLERLKKLECDSCGIFIAYVDENDLNGNYFYCEDCVNKEKNQKTELEYGMEKCPICDSRIIEYDDYVEYGDGEGNDGSYNVLMCSNEDCKNY